MSHGRSPSDPVTIGPEDATEVADAFTALASPGRVLILGRLCRGPSAVAELAGVAGLTPSAASHHLRLLRHMGWVVRERHGRQIVYSLHDHHVSDLLAQALYHLHHVRTGHAEAVEAESAAVGGASPLP